jgi:hypothetical protein
MTLLIMASLFVKSLVNVSREDLGIRIENVVTFGVSPVRNGYSRPRAWRCSTSSRGVRRAPGVTAATASMVPVLSGSSWANDVSVEVFSERPTRMPTPVQSGWTRILQDDGVTLLAGREFTASDIVGTPKVAIVNEAFARKFNLGRTPVGKLMAVGGTDQPLDMEIVGFVKDAKNSDVKDPVPPMYFRPYRQDSPWGSSSCTCAGLRIPPCCCARSLPS